MSGGLALAGDYQTPSRMAAKLAAIPLPENLAGKTVLDVGCDHGAWSKLASDRGAERVLGLDRGREVRTRGGLTFVDLAERNEAQGWPRCEFRSFDLGSEWTAFGTFDVVLFFAVYHHVYGDTGDHDAIWRWLRDHTGEVLLWEGPVSTLDPIVRMRRPEGYTRERIHAAASRYFDVEIVGPAGYRPHREVWRCLPR